MHGVKRQYVRLVIWRIARSGIPEGNSGNGRCPDRTIETGWQIYRRFCEKRHLPPETLSERPTAASGEAKKAFDGKRDATKTPALCWQGLVGLFSRKRERALTLG